VSGVWVSGGGAPTDPRALTRGRGCLLARMGGEQRVTRALWGGWRSAHMSFCKSRALRHGVCQFIVIAVDEGVATTAISGDRDF